MKEMTPAQFKEKFFGKIDDWVPLDFSYEERTFDIVMVVQWRIQDAFLINQNLRSFLEVTVSTKEEYSEMIQYLQEGCKAVVKYLNQHLQECREEGF